jgi:NAD(P)-dependent dehydrogenase (short-subunit alcohol dehydrogenase family)
LRRNREAESNFNREKQMAARLEGKVAIVTGAGRGIGRGEALLLASEGARVVVNDLGGSPAGEGKDTSPADDVVAEIKKLGSDAVANYDNVASMEGGERMVKQALDTWGRLDILVNNAGILRDRMVFNMSEEEWDAVIAVHLKGHFTVTKHASLVFRQQRSGRIVNTSSESGLGNMGQANYSAAKEGITGLTRTLALDLGRYGVTANAIRPRAGTRLTLTPELRAAMERARAATGSRPAGASGGGGDASQSGAQDAISQMDSLKPELVAPLVVFLCTDKAANVNGRDFIVGGNEISLMSLPQKERSIFREGGWTLEALERVFAQTIGAGLKNPMPPQPPKE